jgi:uncharacterized Zn finger protein (UPF0148 family)
MGIKYGNIIIQRRVEQMIYYCNNCGFLFERTGKITQCPDCGKENIEVANATQKEIYYDLRSEFGNPSNKDSSRFNKLLKLLFVENYKKL